MTACAARYGAVDADLRVRPLRPAGTSRCCSRRAAASSRARSPWPASPTWRRSARQTRRRRHERAGDDRQPGHGRVRRRPPARRSARPARAIRARVLYAIAVADTLVPWEQATELRRRAAPPRPAPRTSTLLRLARRRRAVRARASSPQAALQAFYAREQALVAPLAIGDVDRAARACCSPPCARAACARASRAAAAARCRRACELSARTARRARACRASSGAASAKRSSRGRGIAHGAPDAPPRAGGSARRRSSSSAT